MYSTRSLRGPLIHCFMYCIIDWFTHHSVQRERERTLFIDTVFITVYQSRLLELLIHTHIFNWFGQCWSWIILGLCALKHGLKCLYTLYTAIRSIYSTIEKCSKDLSTCFNFSFLKLELELVFVQEAHCASRGVLIE